MYNNITFKHTDSENSEQLDQSGSHIKRCFE